MQSQPDLSQLSHAQKDELIRMLWPLQQQVQDLMAQMVVMQERIKYLEGRLALNSKNSSKPPSSDGLSKPAPKSSRKPGQKPSGGQPGHDGRTLRQSAHVDETVVHQADTHCSACHLELREHTIAEIRQVFELPELRMRTVAHHQMRSRCTCGAVHLGMWPAGVNAPAQYGASVKAMAVHLNQYHLVPLARTAALMQDLYGSAVSQASIQSFAQEAARALQPTVNAIAQAVQASAVVHADESGIRIQGKLHWLHCAVTRHLTWQAPHAKRGALAFEALGLLHGSKMWGWVAEVGSSNPRPPTC